MKRLIATLLPVGLLALAACGGDDADGSSDRFITVYNAQHEELLEEVAPIFEEETGIEVRFRHGKDFELGNQLVAEGDATPADVFLTENSPAMSLVEDAGLLAPVDPATLERIPKQYRPASGLWTGFVARSTVLVYNTDRVSPEELPASLLDLASDEWKGRVSFSPTGADFQAIVSAVLQTQGEAATRTWLEGLADNGRIDRNNLVVMKSVNDGQVDAGVIYHYYWYRDQQESGDNSDNAALHFFGDADPGAFVSVSGAGVLASSDKQDDAQLFLDFLTDRRGQQALADSYALEYPLNPAVELAPPVKPFAELAPPVVDVSELNGPRVIELMQDAGLL